MISISPINNQTTFGAKFIPTQELNIAKKYAAEKDIAKFEQLVSKMQESNDNKVYKLTELVMTSISQVNKYLILYCRNMDNYKLKQNLIKNTIISAENKNAVTENIYEGALKDINRILSRKFTSRKFNKL